MCTVSAASLCLGPQRFLFDHLSRKLGDLPLQSTHARFLGVVTDQVHEASSSSVSSAATNHSARSASATDTLADVELLAFRVSGQPNDLHAVEQRSRNVHGVRGADEEHVGKIVVHLEIVIVERVVLLRVEHLQQALAGSPRTSIPILSTSSSRNSGFLTPPSTSSAGSCRAWSRCRYAGVREFRLRHDAAQRHANELRGWWHGDALAERGLADAGRSDQAQHRAFHLVDPA